MNEYQYFDTIKWLNDKFEESGPRERWSECTRLNLPLIDKKMSVHKFKDIYFGEKEKVIVVVGASPRLNEDVEYLKKLDDKYVIMVSNSAAKFLVDNGIKPHYVVSIDADDIIATRDLDFDTSDLTLITTNASSPEVIKRWKGKILWSSCYSIDPELKPAVRQLLGKRVLLGGNTSTFATSLAFDIFGARIFIFVANEYCYDDQYYAHRRSKWEEENVTHFRTKDVLGRDRLTNFPLYQYKIWLEKMVDQLTFCTFIDTSFGMLGTDCQRLRSMKFPEAIDFVNESFRIKELAKTDWHVREKLRYDAEYSYRTYQPNHGKKAWRWILSKRDHSRIKTALDVGCGFGQGVAMSRNKGMETYGVDISDSLTPYWEMGNIVPFCRVCSADSLPFDDGKFDLVVSFDVLEHIPEEGIDDVLREMYRVGRNDFLFSICIIPAISKMSDGSEPHVLIRPIEWWREKLESIGFHSHFTVLSIAQTHIVVHLTKGDIPVLLTAREEDAKVRVSRRNLHTQPKQGVRRRKNVSQVEGRC